MEHIDLNNIVISIISGLVGVAVVVLKQQLVNYITKFFKGELDPVVETLNVSRLIRDTLNQLLEDWGANRVFIAQFHNGGKFYTGQSMQKLSVVYEEHTPGTYPMIRVMQNVPLSTCLYVKDIIDNKYAIDDVSEITDIVSKTFYFEFGVKSAIGLPLYSGERVIGVLILHYTDKKIKFKPTDLALLRDQCKSLNSLLVV